MDAVVKQGCTEPKQVKAIATHTDHTDVQPPDEWRPYLQSLEFLPGSGAWLISGLFPSFTALREVILPDTWDIVNGSPVIGGPLFPPNIQKIRGGNWIDGYPGFPESLTDLDTSIVWTTRPVDSLVVLPNLQRLVVRRYFPIKCQLPKLTCLHLSGTAGNWTIRSCPAGDHPIFQFPNLQELKLSPFVGLPRGRSEFIERVMDSFPNLQILWIYDQPPTKSIGRLAKLRVLVLYSEDYDGETALSARAELVREQLGWDSACFWRLKHVDPHSSHLPIPCVVYHGPDVHRCEHCEEDSRDCGCCTDCGRSKGDCDCDYGYCDECDQWHDLSADCPSDS